MTEERATGALTGVRVALLEARMSGELARLVERQGGIPIRAPAMSEHPIAGAAEVGRLLDRLARGEFAVAVFLTGVGVRALAQEADGLGRLAELRAALGRLTVVCRGPKPVAALAALDVATDVRAPEPHTTDELLGAMADLPLDGAGVLLLHYGERNQPLADILRGRGAHLDEVCLYEWRLPEDVGPLHALVRQVLDGEIDAIAFTSQVQLRHLLAVAAEEREALLAALRGPVTVASIGPTCTAALRDHGIEPAVEPEHPKMGHLILALARQFERAPEGQA